MSRQGQIQSPVFGPRGISSDIFDNKNNKNQSFISTRNTFNIKNKSQFYRTQRHPRLPAWKDISNWKESASSMTRDRSPQHRFPQQKRFTSIQQDRARSCGDKNKLNLRLELEGGKSFAHSKRPVYFPPEHSIEFPAPGNYGLKRWLEEEDNHAETPSLTLNGPKIESATQRSRKSYSSIIRGRTIGRQIRDNSKLYLDHARNHVNHHQNIVIGHPGVGRYTISVSPGKNKPAYNMGETLIHHRDDFPAPNAYTTNIKFSKPSTTRDTLDKAKRLDFAKPLNENPGPNEYCITRFLEGKKKGV